MNTLVSGMQDATNKTTTTNGAKAFNSTKSFVLDFFSRGSAIRDMDEVNQVNLFASAFMENPELALKAMFYSRDIRGGQGQRQPFRSQLKYLANMNPSIAKELT